MKKPFNRVFTAAYHVLGPIIRLWHPTTVEGAENIPQEGGVLFCPNHSSNWDPILVVLALPVNTRVRVMGKEELFRNPLLRWLLHKAGAFPVSRGSADIKAVKTAIQTIKSGDNLLMFPEGTVIRNGIGYVDGLPPHAHSGAAVIGVRAGAKLVPVFTDGEKKAFRPSRIIFGKPMEPRYTGRHGTAEEMQKIADDVLAAAYALGGQEVGGKPLCK